MTGPNLCWIGNDKQLLPEAMGLILRNEADACIVIYSRVISTAAAELANLPKAAIACAALLERGGAGMEIPEDLSPDMDSFCAEVSGRISSL